MTAKANAMIIQAIHGTGNPGGKKQKGEKRLHQVSDDEAVGQQASARPFNKA